MKTLYKGEQIDVDLTKLPMLQISIEALEATLEILEFAEIGKVLNCIYEKVKNGKDPDTLTKHEQGIYKMWINNICRAGAVYQIKVDNFKKYKENKKDKKTANMPWLDCGMTREEYQGVLQMSDSQFNSIFPI